MITKSMSRNENMKVETFTKIKGESRLSFHKLEIHTDINRAQVIKDLEHLVGLESEGRIEYFGLCSQRPVIKIKNGKWYVSQVEYFDC